MQHKLWFFIFKRKGFLSYYIKNIFQHLKLLRYDAFISSNCTRSAGSSSQPKICLALEQKLLDSTLSVYNMRTSVGIFAMKINYHILRTIHGKYYHTVHLSQQNIASAGCLSNGREILSKHESVLSPKISLVLFRQWKRELIF